MSVGKSWFGDIQLGDVGGALWGSPPPKRKAKRKKRKETPRRGMDLKLVDFTIPTKGLTLDVFSTQDKPAKPKKKATKKMKRAWLSDEEYKEMKRKKTKEREARRRRQKEEEVRQTEHELDEAIEAYMSDPKYATERDARRAKVWYIEALEAVIRIDRRGQLLDPRVSLHAAVKQDSEDAIAMARKHVREKYGADIAEKLF